MSDIGEAHASGELPGQLDITRHLFDRIIEITSSASTDAAREIVAEIGAAIHALECKIEGIPIER